MTLRLSALVSQAPWLFAAASAVVGACIGSFLNVVIRRLPAGKSIATPGSHCDCGAPIAWRDNVPILSWLILGGRARCCGRRISAQYPLVELATSLLFLAAWLRLAPGPAVCGWVFLSGLVAATAIDLEHLEIPDSLTLGLGLSGVALSALVPSLQGPVSGYYALDSLRSGTASLCGLLVGSGLVLWIALLAEAALKEEAMGFGDVKFTGAIGAFCGWHGAVFAVFGGACIGTVGLALALVLRRRPGRGARVPFGPMLALAAALYLLVLRAPVDAWFAKLAALY
jgi:leader peptidase (prepilin peptidase)/N-methyltransferase